MSDSNNRKTKPKWHKTKSVKDWINYERTQISIVNAIMEDLKLLEITQKYSIKLIIINPAIKLTNLLITGDKLHIS